ncbi:MAG: SDR family NAD(P)-dependent oxidoreductase [Acidobacteriota bacterium]
MAKLTGQTAIVTGASSGIGEAIARHLARDGATVVITARRQERLDKLKLEIEQAGGKALRFAGDINGDEFRKQLVDETMTATGRIDALINNAGYGQRGPVEIVPLATIRRNFETNFFSAVALAQLVIPVMRTQQKGSIINISSVAGKISRPLSSIYSATKFALEAISDGMRLELAPFGIRVVIIEPGFITSEFLEVATGSGKELLEIDSPYNQLLENSASGKDYQRLRKMAGTPDDIAAIVVEALTTNHPRPRYAAPFHAKFAIAMKRWLPERLTDRVLVNQSGMNKK